MVCDARDKLKERNFVEERYTVILWWCRYGFAYSCIVPKRRGDPFFSLSFFILFSGYFVVLIATITCFVPSEADSVTSANFFLSRIALLHDFSVHPQRWRFALAFFLGLSTLRAPPALLKVSELLPVRDPSHNLCTNRDCACLSPAAIVDPQIARPVLLFDPKHQQDANISNQHQLSYDTQARAPRQSTSTSPVGGYSARRFGNQASGESSTTGRSRTSALWCLPV